MNRPTFERIVKEHLDWIRRLLSILGVCARDLDDVVQEVLLAVHRGLPAFDPSRAARPEGAVRAWLLAICDRQAANRRRCRARRKEELCDDDELDGFESGSPNEEDRYLICDAWAHLESILVEIEPQRRAVFVAYELEEAPMPEIARTLGIPVNTAWNHLRLARADIRAKSDRHRRRKVG